MINYRRYAPLALLLGLTTACGTAPVPASDTEAAAASEGAPATDVQLTTAQIESGGIVVTELTEETWAETFEAPAVVQLDQRRTARVGALVDARVDEVHVEVGDTVKQGAVLAEMHSHLTHDAVAALRKSLSAVARLEGELGFAKATLGRYQRLLADGAASPQDEERAATAVASLGRDIEMARADETRARSELRHYGVNADAAGRADADGHPNDQIPVRAPQSGVVLERMVTPGTTVTSGQEMFVVSDLSTVWVTGEVDERWAPLLRKGGAATVRLTAFPDEAFTATVTYIGDVVAADTRRISVRVELSNRDRRVKPEMFARLVLSGASRTALSVPGDAIQHVDGRDVVFVETAPGRFAPVAVRTSAVAAEGGRVALLDGVAAGSRVVTQGAFLVRSEFQKAMLEEDE